MTKGAKGAADQFNKFVEGDEAKSRVAPEKKDFWDSFGASAEESGPSSLGSQAMGGAGGAKKNSSIGTSAMKKNDEKADGWGDDF
jgi:ADP-ribosylation factor GTPase-activating protein 1